MSCLFCRILQGEIPSRAVYSDERCYAFADIQPQAPVHLLIIPRQHIDSLANATATDMELLGYLTAKAAELARELSLDHGYRVVINTGDDGGQTVHHLHLHLLGGRSLKWPPG